MSRQVYATLTLALLVIACDSGPPSGTTEPPPIQLYPSMGTVSARVGEDDWVSGHVLVRSGGGLMYIEATAWPGNSDTRHYLILSFETGTESLVRVIGPGMRASASASIEYFGGWIANDAMGSGTITLTSLTSERATGTFAFSGQASGAISPPVIAVTNGRFDVRLK